MLKQCAGLVNYAQAGWDVGCPEMHRSSGLDFGGHPKAYCASLVTLKKRVILAPWGLILVQRSRIWEP